MDPDVGVLAFESTGVLKRADPLAVAASEAPIRIDEYDFHDEQYLPEVMLSRFCRLSGSPVGLFPSAPLKRKTVITMQEVNYA